MKPERIEQGIFHSIFSHMGAGACYDEIIYEDGRAVNYRILEVNRSFARILHLDPEKIEGRLASEVYGTRQAPFLDIYTQVAESGEPVTFESYFEPAAIYLQITASCPELGKFSTVFNDISERKRLEKVQEAAQKEYIELNDQLRQAQKMEAIGHLAGGVAHDFNNILQAIIGYAQFIETFDDDPEKIRESVRGILSSADKAADLTKQLLSFSRKQNLDMKLLDINTLVSDFSRMLKRIIGEHISISWKPGKEDPRVLADPGMLEQVIMNICMNSRYAMPEGGELFIECTTVDLDDQYVRRHVWAAPGRYVLLSLTDTGTGMDMETLEHIFEPFFTTKPEEEGTGLGLSTAYGIIQQHDGMLLAYSEPGRGTTFKIYLPEQQGENPIPRRTSKGEAPLGGDEVILIAEDDLIVRELTKKMLLTAGYTVLAAEDGQEAIALFKEHREKIALMILDVIMPGTGGCETYQSIQRLSGDIPPVLFSSGYSAHTVKKRLIMDESIEMLQKPFTQDSLLRTVRRLIDA